METEVIEFLKPDPIEPKIGFLFPANWEEMLETGTHPEDITLEKVYYIEFERKAILGSGANYFYTQDGGKVWRKANDLLCRNLYKTEEEALEKLREERDDIHRTDAFEYGVRRSAKNDQKKIE